MQRCSSLCFDSAVVISLFHFSSLFFFFNDTATTEIYTLSLHDALPIYFARGFVQRRAGGTGVDDQQFSFHRSEEHTSELQSHSDLVCRLLLEKKKHQAPHDVLTFH